MAASRDVDYVLDASALAKLFLEEPESERFREWYVTEVHRGATFGAPGLVAYEVAHLLGKKVTPPDGEDAASWLAQRHDDVLDGIELDHRAPREVFAWMERLSGYDASYLAAAYAAAATLVSYDAALRKAAARAGVATVAP